MRNLEYRATGRKRVEMDVLTEIGFLQRPQRGHAKKCFGGGSKAHAVAGVFLMSVFVFMLAGCGNQGSNRGSSATAASAHDAAAPNNSQAQLFAVPENQMEHVRIVTVEPSSLPRLLRLTGTVQYNSFQTTPVITQVSGPVTRVLVVPGQRVRAGQPMLYVSSPDFAQLRASYLKARDAVSLAQQNYARDQDLYSHHAVAEADLLQAESTRNQAQADLDAATQSLETLGIAKPDGLASQSTTAAIPVLAPISGEVVERLVAPGQVVQAGSTQVFTISNMSTVWVIANVYESDLGSVHSGEPVNIQTDAYPETFQGRISYVSPALDPATRTLQVRIETRNPQGRLKKDMYVTATVHAGQITGALTVPDAAVLRNSENEPFVYVQQESKQFAQRLVSIGESQNGQTQILSGLKEGERVIGDGSLFLQFENSFQH